MGEWVVRWGGCLGDVQQQANQPVHHFYVMAHPGQAAPCVMVGPGPTTHDFTVFRADITIAPKRLNRHGRPCPGHPSFIRRRADGLDTPGHNNGETAST
jgi:hypothetical protein